MLSLLMPSRSASEGYGPLSDFWYSPVGQKVSAGVNVTADTAMTYSAVWAATRILSATAGRLPLNLYQRSGERGKAIARGDIRNRLVFRQPNNRMIPMLFKSAGVAQQINAGNAYAEIQRGKRGEPIAFWPIHHSRVKPVVDEATDELYYRVGNNSGSHVDLPAADVLHFPSMMSDDGICGKGVIAHARETIGTGLAATSSSGSTFGSGGLPRVVVESPKKWSEDSRRNFRKEWKEIYGGPNGDKVGVMDEGSKLHVLGVNYRDLQFLELQQHTVEEIARWYGVPPHKIQSLLRATFCLPASEPVFTEYGPKSIAEVRVGERVWSYADDGSWQLSPVLRSGCTGVDEIISIHTRTRSLRCNKRHRVLVRRKIMCPFTGGGGRCILVNGVKCRTEWRVEYIPAGDIVVGDQIVAADKLPSTACDRTPTRKASVPLMESLGMLIGDGYFARTGKKKQYLSTFGISHAENADYLPHYIAAIEAEFFCCSKPYDQVKSRNGVKPLKARVRDKNTTCFYSMKACRELQAMGIVGTAKTKRVPPWVYGLSRELKLAFLRGYLDADGTVSKQGGTRFVSCNRDLIEDVRHLCMSVGVRCGHVIATERASCFEGYDPTRTMLYHVACSDPETASEIGTHTPWYRERWEAAIQKKRVRSRDLYPHEIRQRENRPGVSFELVQLVERDPIAEPVYDLEVAGTHSFIANGVVVHNSNIEHQSKEFIDDSLMPWLVIWEEELDKKLLTEDEQEEMFFAFNPTEYLRGDTAARSQYWQMMVNSSIATRNEARVAEDMNPVDGGDTFLVQGAMVALDEEGKPSGGFGGEGKPPFGKAAQPPKDDPQPDDSADEGDPSNDDSGDNNADGKHPFRWPSDGQPVRFLFEATIARMIRIETDELKSAAKKPRQFIDEITAFYSRYQSKLHETVKPLVGVLAMVGVDIVLEEFVAAHIAESRDQAISIADTNTAATILGAADDLANDWETNRAAEIVREFFERAEQ